MLVLITVEYESIVLLEGLGKYMVDKNVHGTHKSG